MQNFLMNLSGVAAIAGMLYGMLVMWRNIDKELAKMDAGKKKAECGKLHSRSTIASASTIAVCHKIDSGKRAVASSARKMVAQPISA